MILDIPPAFPLEELRRALLAAVPELHPTLDTATMTLAPSFSVDAAARKLDVPDALAPRAQAVLDVPAKEATLRSRAEGALATLEAAWDGWDTLTAVQKDAALKLNVRATAALIRLVLRRL